jgi:hypothetical protein
MLYNRDTHNIISSGEDARTNADSARIYTGYKGDYVFTFGT